MTSLQLRCHKLLLNYGSKICVLPTHVNHVVFTENCTEQFILCDVLTMHVYPIVLSTVPPLLLRKPQCRLDLANARKLAVHPSVWELQFCLATVDYKDHALYTDRLKMANGVGILFVVHSDLLLALQLYTIWQEGIFFLISVWMLRKQGLKTFSCSAQN